MIPTLLYIDISAVSYLIPIIAGVAITISSAVYLFVRRARSKVSKKLGIDENAGKEVEEDLKLVVNEDDVAASEDNSAVTAEEDNRGVSPENSAEAAAAGGEVGDFGGEVSGDIGGEGGGDGGAE